MTKMKTSPYKPLSVKEPRTPHEEILICIESTNDIVSKILEEQKANKERMKRLVEWALKESESTNDIVSKMLENQSTILELLTLLGLPNDPEKAKME